MWCSVLGCGPGNKRGDGLRRHKQRGRVRQGGRRDQREGAWHLRALAMLLVPTAMMMRRRRCETVARDDSWQRVARGQHIAGRNAGPEQQRQQQCQHGKRRKRCWTARGHAPPLSGSTK